LLFFSFRSFLARSLDLLCLGDQPIKWTGIVKEFDLLYLVAIERHQVSGSHDTDRLLEYQVISEDRLIG
jgi:hypothetical protein